MTAANYTVSVLPFTLRYEGGKVDNPRDPGGRTNQGITQNTFDAYLKRCGQPARDVYTMTGAERDAIYRSGYWDTLKGDSLPDGVDLMVFDYGVNSGPARPLKVYAQRTTNDASANVQAICAARLSFLHALATFKVFGKGWTARVAACEALGLKMAEHARIGVPVTAPATPGTAAKLLVESQTAASKATAHRKKAAGAVTAAGAGAATQTPAAPPAAHLPVALLVLLALAALGVTAWLLWRAHVQKTRAAALAAVAQEGAAPPAPAAAPR